MDNIIEALAQYFSPKFKEKLKRAENLSALLHKLEKKEIELNEALKGELTISERQVKETKLSVLLAQKEKAILLLNQDTSA